MTGSHIIGRKPNRFKPGMDISGRTPNNMTPGRHIIRRLPYHMTLGRHTMQRALNNMTPGRHRPLLLHGEGVRFNIVSNQNVKTSVGESETRQQ